MAVTIVGTPTVSSSGTGTATSCQPALSTGWAAGDVAFLGVFTNPSTQVFTKPAGWTQVADQTTNNLRAYVAYRVLQAGDTAPLTSISSANQIAGGLIVLRGVDVNDIFGTATAFVQDTTADTAAEFPALTPRNADDFALWITGLRGATGGAAVTHSTVPTAGGTGGSVIERLDHSTTRASNPEVGVAIFTKQLITATGWAPSTTTVSSSAVSATWAFAIKAAVATTQVLGSRSTTWGVRGQGTGSRGTTWAVRQTRTSARATTWGVRRSLEGTRATAWPVRVLRTGSRVTTWAVGGRVTGSRSTTWGVGGRVLGSRATSWLVATAGSGSQSTEWAVRGQVFGAAVNHASNPSGEVADNFVGTSSGSLTIELTTTEAWVGLQSFREFWNREPAANRAQARLASLALPAGTYTSKVRFKAPASNVGPITGFSAQLRDDIQGVFIPGTASTSLITVEGEYVPGQWVTVAHTVTVPEGYTYGSIYWRADCPDRVQTDEYFWDGFQVTTSPDSPYFDGDSPGGRWLGTPGLSPSERLGIATGWSTRQQVTGSRSTTWATRQPVTGARSTSWQVRGGLSGSRSTSWAVRRALSGSRTASWGVRAGQAGTRATTWALRGLAAGSRATSWITESTVPTEQVLGSRATTWGVRQRHLASRSTGWGVRQGRLGARSTTWATRRRLTGSRSTTWLVRRRLFGTRSALWAVRVPAAGSRSTSWVVRVQRSASRSTTWSTRSRVVGIRGTVWAVRRSFEGTRVTTWAVRGSDAGSITTVWAVRQEVTGGLADAWVVRQEVHGTRGTTWQVKILAGTHDLDLAAVIGTGSGGRLGSPASSTRVRSGANAGLGGGSRARIGT